MTCVTGLGLAILANQRGAPGREWRMSWPLGWQLLYLFLAFAVIFVATSIYQARTHSQKVSATTAAPGMLFPLMLLERFSVANKVDETAYLGKLKTLQTADLLEDYVNQIIEVSIIYREKQKQVNLGLRLFRLTGILWLITMVAVVLVSILLP